MSKARLRTCCYQLALLPIHPFALFPRLRENVHLVVATSLIPLQEFPMVADSTVSSSPKRSTDVSAHIKKEVRTWEESLEDLLRLTATSYTKRGSTPLDSASGTVYLAKQAEQAERYEGRHLLLLDCRCVFISRARDG